MTTATKYVDLSPRSNSHHRPAPPEPGDLLSSRPDVVLAAIGLVTIAALVPLRASWAAQVVLLALVLTLPGVLLVRALRLPAPLTIPLSVPGSLLVLLASGLAVNTVGRPLGIDAPLRPFPVLIALELVGVVLLAIVARRTSGVEPQFGWSRLLGRWDLLAPAVVPLVALLGALRLNAVDSAAVTANSTSGVVAAGTIVAGSLAVAGAVLVLAALVGGLVVARRADDLLLGATIYAAGLAVLWSFSLRAESIYGYDVMNEFRKMIETIDAGWWSSFRPGDAYGAMLSVTVLPAQLNALSGVSAEILVKVVFPAIFATTPVIVYALCRRFLRPRWAFLGAALLVVQPNFGQQMPGLAKQEIGFVLFAALLLVLVSRITSRATQAASIVVLALGVVVTHYSSTYFGIVILGAGLGMSGLVTLFRRSGRGGTARWRQVAMVGLATVTLVVGAGLWNTTVTHSSSNVSDAALGFELSGFDLLPNRAIGDDLLTGYIKGNTTPQISAGEYEQLVTGIYGTDRRYILPTPDAGAYPIADVGGAAPISIPQVVVGFGLQQIAYLMAGVAALVLLLRRRSSPTDRLVGAMILGSVMALALLRLSGTLAQAYNQDRALLQALMVLVVGVGWSAQRLSSWRPRVTTAGAVVMVGALFALNSSLLGAFTGQGRINLAGGGEDFQRFYTYRAEVTAARWLGDQTAARRQVVYADRYGTLRFLLGTGRQVGVFPEIVPKVIDKSAWIYATSANVREGRVRSQTAGQMATYGFPTGFLDSHFDVVYTNGTSTVYHR